MTFAKVIRLPEDWLFPWTIEFAEDAVVYQEFLDVRVGDIVEVSTKGPGRVRLYRPDTYLDIDDLEYLSGDPFIPHQTQD